MTNEKELIAHYDANVEYHSAVRGENIDKVFEAVGLEVPHGKEVLDLGCGTGEFCREMWNLGNKVTGVDYSSVRTSHATAITGTHIPFYCMTLQYFRLWWGLKADVITAFDVLEHLEQPAEVVESYKELLLPGGVIIAAVPLRMPYVAHLQVWHNVFHVKEELNASAVVSVMLDREYAVCTWRND